MTDDIQSMEVSGYLCSLTSTGLVGIESSRNIYVPTLIAAELTGLSISDLKVMRSLRMGFPSSSTNPKSVMTSAQLEIPKSLVDLLASENRPAIRAFLDGASFPQSQASSNIAGDVRSQGSQTEALDVEAQEIEESQWIQKEAAVVVARLKQSRWGIGLGVASPWKRLIFLCVLAIILPLLFTLLWASSPVAWLSKDPAHGSIMSLRRPRPGQASFQILQSGLL